MDGEAPSPGPAAASSAASDGESARWHIYERHRAWMLRYATTVTGDTETAEDLVETVLVKVVLGNTPVVRRWEEYLRKALFNEWRDELRRCSLFVSLSDSVAEHAVAQAAGCAHSEAVIDLEKLLAILTPGCAAIVRARASGMSNREIAAELDLSVNTVCAQLQRAKFIVRRHVANQKNGTRPAGPTPDRVGAEAGSGPWGEAAWRASG
jgi:RNA polymerase sigma factor (sigma-70 family)